MRDRQAACMIGTCQGLHCGWILSSSGEACFACLRAVLFLFALVVVPCRQVQEYVPNSYVKAGNCWFGFHSWFVSLSKLSLDIGMSPAVCLSDAYTLLPQQWLLNPSEFWWSGQISAWLHRYWQGLSMPVLGSLQWVYWKRLYICENRKYIFWRIPSFHLQWTIRRNA